MGGRAWGETLVEEAEYSNYIRIRSGVGRQLKGVNLCSTLSEVILNMSTVWDLTLGPNILLFGEWCSPYLLTLTWVSQFWVSVSSPRNPDIFNSRDGGVNMEEYWTYSPEISCLIFHCWQHVFSGTEINSRKEHSCMSLYFWGFNGFQEISLWAVMNLLEIRAGIKTDSLPLAWCWMTWMDICWGNNESLVMQTGNCSRLPGLRFIILHHWVFESLKSSQ